MSIEGKVLLFPLKKKLTEESEGLHPRASVVDIVAKRDEIIQNERRAVKRTILNGFIGVHVVIPENRRRKSTFHNGLLRCSLHDISSDESGGGVSFDLEEKKGHFQSGEEVQMRVYLNHKTYFGFLVKVRSFRLVKEEAVYRHGASFVKNSFNQEAIGHFVRFIESVSASLKTDHGDVIVSNLD